MTNVIDGKSLAGAVIEDCRRTLALQKDRPELAIVSFGGSQSAFIRQKQKIADELGIAVRHCNVDSDMPSSKFRQKLNSIVRSPGRPAVVVQLPLPQNISPRVLNVIPPLQDPDILSDRAVGQFFNNAGLCMPPTAAAIFHILDTASIDCAGAQVSVLGYGTLVGRFVAKLLIDRGAYVRVAHRVAPGDIGRFTAGSDIIVSAQGTPHAVSAADLPANSAVIDAGFSTLDGKVLGDVNFDSHERFRMVSPVPGGVGPLGVAFLFKNIIELFRRMSER